MEDIARKKIWGHKPDERDKNDSDHKTQARNRKIKHSVNFVKKPVNDVYCDKERNQEEESLQKVLTYPFHKFILMRGNILDLSKKFNFVPKANTLL